jgi:hypothetical protein
MKRIMIIALLAGVWGILSVNLYAQGSNETQQQPLITQHLFASPDEAVKALQVATGTKDKAALNQIFGSQVKELLTGDEVQDTKNAQKFASVIAQGYTLVKDGEDKMTIEVGPESWPMPIPLVKSTDGVSWYFDTAAGKEEIINRHIGKDELHAIGVCRGFAAGKKQFANIPQPFHGYLFRILNSQGPDAAGGSALVAYPEHWDQSGIMTFIVNQDGKIYQRNYAEKTSQVVKAMTEYNPDSEWTLVTDQGVLNPVSGT